MKKSCLGIYPSMRFILMFSLIMTLLITGCTKTEILDDRSGETDKVPPTVISVDPENNVNTVSLTAKPSVLFSETMSVETLTTASFIVKKGNTELTGTVTYSGKIATFNPSAPFEANTQYTCIINTSVKDVAGNALAVTYTWNFTTGGLADITSPLVVAVLPAGNAISVAPGTNPSVTFSEPMNAVTINSASFTLKKGSTGLQGTVSCSGSAATLDPVASLEPNTIYTCTITTSAKDLAGNALASDYTWTFTTGVQADVTAPTVQGVAPANNATSVPVSIRPAVTFSEPMNPATITPSSFTLKQGSITVAGTVLYSGTTAIFTPSGSLAGNTVYTAIVTTSVRDAAGNPLASVYSWSFTTVVTATAKSFSAEVVPILNKCNTCHKHNWQPSPTPSVFHANLVSSGHINMTTPTSGKIYTKLSGGHPSSTVTAAEKTIVLTWIQEGSKNN